jgi:DNA-directed RNA polymerase
MELSSTCRPIACLRRVLILPTFSSEFQPAFSHSYEYVRGNKLGVITLNPEVASRMAKDSVSLVVHPKHMPMLIPPRRWAAHDDGAYLFHKG